MMARFFLIRERLEIGNPVLTAADVQMMLVHISRAATARHGI